MTGVAAQAARIRNRPWGRNAIRLAILEAARRIVACDGPQAVTLGRAADEAGFARATIFGHFRNKEELLMSIVADDLATLGRVMQSSGWTLDLREEAPAIAAEPVAEEIPEPVAEEVAAPIEEQAEEPAPEIFTPAIVESVSFETAAEEPAPIETVEEPAAEPKPEFPRIVPRENLRATLQAKLAPVEEPQPALKLEIPRVDAWLERRLRVFERSLADIEARLEKAERGSQRAEGLVEDNVRDLAQRLEAAERRQRENVETVSKRVEATDSRHRATVAELRGMLNDAFQKLHDPNANFEMPEESEPVAEESFEPTPAPEPAEPTPPREPSQSFLSAARRAANAAAELAEAERKSQKHSTIWDGRERRKLDTRYLMAGAGMLVLVILAAGMMLRNGASIAKPAAPPVAKIAIARTPAAAIAAPSNAAPLDRLTSLANSGNAQAELLVGLKYLHGDGTTENDAQAAQWLGVAANAHEPLAQYWFGTLYEHGQGVTKDLAQAAHWYAAAASQGNLKAMYRLGVAYAEGNGVTKDPAQAALWFSKAANSGLVDAEFNLAVLYERGQGVTQSLLDAYKWYAIAAAQGDAESKLRMDAIATQLSPDALSAAEGAVQTFKPAPLDESANVVPELTALSSQ